MDSVPKIDRVALKATLMEEVERTIQAVADAVDNAPAGRIIRDSEEPARVALDRFRQLAYEAAIQAKTEAAEAAFSPPSNPTTGQKLKHKGRQTYSLLTVNGRLRIRRVRWHDPEQGSCTPVDLLLDAAEQTISEGVREMACRLNRGATSFAQTADHLARAAHLNVSKETLRTLIEHEGREVLERQQQGVLSPEWTAEDCQTSETKSSEIKTSEIKTSEIKTSEIKTSEVKTSEIKTSEIKTSDLSETKTRVYLGCDGVMVPLITAAEKQKRRAKIKQKRQRCGRKCRPLPKCKPGADQAYKEFKLGVLYDETMQHRYVNVTSGNHEVAGRMLKRMATQVGLKHATEKIAIADGSPWIRNQIELHGLVDALGLDYYHLRENVQKARLAVYGEASAEGQQWRDELLSLFFEQGVDAAWEYLLAWQKKLRGCKRMAANQLLGYVAERRETICYPEFRRRGWQIGSGPTEAQCKSSTQRVKGRGRRWDRRNAESIIALDCLHNSHAWKNYWLTPKPSRI